jgi:hypothetical protein
MPELLANPSFKRIVFAVVGFAVVALNKRLGLNLDSTEVVSLLTLVLGFVAASNAKEVAIAKSDAAAKVVDVQAAVDVINGPGPKP